MRGGRRWTRLAEDISEQEFDFIANGIETLVELPPFHGIPKIHKNPWKLRPIAPIAPMHSWVKTNVAIWLHIQLAPFLTDFPWILRSTKDRTAMISKIVVPERKDGYKMYKCTGDVVAMYPSIPLNDTDKGNPNIITWGLYSMLDTILVRLCSLHRISIEKQELISQAIRLVNSHSYLT